ncbi:MAG: hypothetical protein AB8G23_03320 [Myxococcota bacterium]
MRAAVLTGVNQPLEILDVQTDQPGPHEVLIRTAAALLGCSIVTGFDALKSGEVARSVIRMND